VSFEKVFEVEIDGKPYNIEIDNMAYLKFERLMGKSAVTWAIEAMNTTGQPKYEDMLKLLICALAKHHPKLRLTVDLLQSKIPTRSMFINLGKISLGDTLIKALHASFAEDEDIKGLELESLEDSEPDPLAEKPRDGGT
jgi:hypothetical protein